MIIFKVLLFLIILCASGFAKVNLVDAKNDESIIKIQNKNLKYLPFSLKNQSKLDLGSVLEKNVDEAYILWSFGSSNRAIHKKILNSNSLYFFSEEQKKGFNVIADHKHVGFQQSAHFVAISKIDLKQLNSIKYKVTLPYIDLSLLNYAGGVLLAFSSQPKVQNNFLLSVKAKGLFPGDIHNIHKFDLKIFQKLKRLILFGGGAIPNSASNNLINGISLTGKEDWNGSAGTRWDVDEFKIDDNNQVFFTKRSRSLNLQIDPLMQWIFLAGYLLEFQ